MEPLAQIALAFRLGPEVFQVFKECGFGAVLQSKSRDLAGDLRHLFVSYDQEPLLTMVSEVTTRNISTLLPVVLTVKYPRKAIHAEMLKRREGAFEETLGCWGCRLIEFGGEADKVHLLIETTPTVSLSRLIGNLKTVSSRRIRLEFAGHFREFFWKPIFWNSAYAVISTGGHASIETLLRYIQNQEAPKAQPKTARLTHN